MSSLSRASRMARWIVHGLLGLPHSSLRNVRPFPLRAAEARTCTISRGIGIAVRDLSLFNSFAGHCTVGWMQVDVGDPQRRALGQPQAGVGTHQDRWPNPDRKRAIECPHLLGRGDVRTRLAIGGDVRRAQGFRATRSSSTASVKSCERRECRA